MLAAAHGQIWNASALGKSLGISYHTVNSYLDHLIGAGLVRRLPAYHANLRKRLVKSPKVYWRDTGLLHSLLGAQDRAALLAKPWVGASWEGLVIEQVLGTLAALDRRHRAFFLRTSDAKEIDLVLEVDDEIWALEAKLSTAPSHHDMARLDAVADLIGAQRPLPGLPDPRAGRRRSAGVAQPGVAARLARARGSMTPFEAPARQFLGQRRRTSTPRFSVRQGPRRRELERLALVRRTRRARMLDSATHSPGRNRRRLVRGRRPSGGYEPPWTGHR
jgi:hypothetical protein